jgi:hypothetical protein
MMINMLDDFARVLVAIRDRLEGLAVAKTTGTVVARITLAKDKIVGVVVERER